ncbi:ABC transporter substrate-binding protein [Serratia sp. M24T3]|nr:ABC transporter substrate-binding protein [Serratia sp. M24T3]EIC84317.1 family 1 extracellular solute-binding protein [Serratia sp. M24T3]
MKTVSGSRISFMAFSLAAVLMSSSLAAQAETTLYVGMNGGTMQQTYTDYVFPPFEKANNVKVVVVPGTSSDILAKAIASKERPQMHLMFLDDGVMYRAISMNLCEKQQPSPASAQLYPQAHIEGDMATGISMGLTGLGYNTKIFAENKWPAPTSWNDLADPKYKGKVVFQSLPSSTFGLHGFLMINRLHGGTESNVEPGFKAWPSTVGPNVKVYIANSATLAEMIQTSQAAIFPFTPTLAAALKSQGLPVAYASPKEGGVLLMSAQCVLANNSSPELAQKLAAWVISPEAQKLALDHAAYSPTNTQVTESGAAGEQLKQMQSYVKNAVVLDWKTINQNRPKWNTQWNRSVEQ